MDFLCQYLTKFDSIVANFIVSFNTPFLTTSMKAVTLLGSGAVLMLLSLLVFFILYWHKRDWYSLTILFVFGGGWVLGAFLKLIVRRPRPDVLRLVEVSGYSFPSGHALLSTVFYGFLAYLLWSYFRQSRFRYVTSFGLAILVALIGISRIYLGAHYPSDVFAGFVVGGCWLAVCILVSRMVSKKPVVTQVDDIKKN